MFENILVSPLAIIVVVAMVAVVIMVLSFVKYMKTKDKAKGLILFSIGLVFLGLSLIVHYIIMDKTSVAFLFLGIPDIIFAVLLGLKGMYELGTKDPRTYLIANQEMHIIGPVVLKYYNWKECYYFRATSKSDEVDNLHVIPIAYAIPTKEFLKVPNRDSTFRTDKRGKIKQDTIEGKEKQDIII